MSAQTKESGRNIDFPHHLIETGHPYGVYMQSIPAQRDERVRLARSARNSSCSSLMPISGSSSENQVTQPLEYVDIRNDYVRVGNIIAEPHMYVGDSPFRVSHGSTDPYIIKPFDRFLVLHVLNFNKNEGHSMPIAKIKQIKEDFQNLCWILDNPEKYIDSFNRLSVLALYRNAPLFGISHLVRLLSRNGLPTWDIVNFPNYRKAFHTFDSQIVSWLWGGTRRVRASDIQVFFLTPQLRKQLILNDRKKNQVQLD